MHIRKSTLDDLLRSVLSKLLQSKAQIKASRGDTRELAGVLLELTNPRARLSRTERKGTMFSCLGELCWYLAGSNSLKFISHYIKLYAKDSDDGKTVYGAYGPRLFRKDGVDQVSNILRILRDKPTSRRAVIQLFDARDIAGERRTEIPCTCTMQFMVRDSQLDMISCMRSNDAFKGLPHDVFTFTMLQEIVARSLSVDVGSYRHFAGSLHLYASDFDAASQYISEGWQPTVNVSMPPMPSGDPWPAVRKLLSAERAVRAGKSVDAAQYSDDTYWQDIIKLLQFYKFWKDRRDARTAREKGVAGRRMRSVRSKVSSPLYQAYMAKKHVFAGTVPKEDQLPLFKKDDDAQEVSFS